MDVRYGSWFGWMLAVGVLVGGCGGAGKAGAGATKGEGVAELRVVKTWEDLMKQEEVVVEGAAYRLGIEAGGCEAGTGVLVYCAPTIAPGERAYLGSEGEPLGPLNVRVVRLEPDTLRGLEERTGTFPAEENRPMFWAAAARVRGAGGYEVQVIDRKSEVVAKRRIEVVKGEGLAWMRFRTVALTKEAEGDLYELAEEMGFPRWDGTKGREKVGRLPEFMKGEEDAGLEVSAKGGAVTVKSAAWVEGYLPERWLVRWWVNGRAVTRAAEELEKVKELREGRRQEASVEEHEPMEFRFRLAVDGQKLGAGPGDVVEFQLMYCRDGLEGDARLEEMEELLRKEGEEARWLRVSKRVRWER